MSNKPNHICKNPHCTKGDDGNRMRYYACNDCDKRNSWRAVACSEECYGRYLDAINISRASEVIETDSTQLSLFDMAPEETVEASPEQAVVDEPKIDNNAFFTGYSKKNKHYR